MKGLEKLTPKHVIIVMLIGLVLLIVGAVFQLKDVANVGYGAIVISALVYMVLRKRFYPKDEAAGTEDPPVGGDQKR